MFASSIYRYSPIWAQEALVSLRAWSRAHLREGRMFESLRVEAEASQWSDREAMARYRVAMLFRVVEHAAAHCAFYKQRFDAAGFRPRDVREESDLARLQLLDKSTVQEAGRSVLSKVARRPLFEGGTSGTTGAPLRLFQDLHAINRENAFLSRQLAWAGLTPKARRAWIRGDMVAPMSQIKPPFWRHNRAENMLMLSSYHLSEPNALPFLEALSAFDPAVIQAYPSSIGFLANWLEAAGRWYGGSALNGIVTSSESLPEGQRAVIERRFGCRVFDWYGQFERVAAIGTCEEGSYHALSDYSLIEFLPVDGGLHEVVGTGFNNLAMPLIRYRTGDFVELAEAGESCRCGRSFPIVHRIYGRTDDVVKLRDGRHIGRLDHIFKGADGVIEAQIRQDTIDRIDILVVPGAGYGVKVEHVLMKNARERLGNSISIAISAVGNIPRTKNGKFRGVICNV